MFKDNTVIYRNTIYLFVLAFVFGTEKMPKIYIMSSRNIYTYFTYRSLQKILW